MFLHLPLITFGDIQVIYSSTPRAVDPDQHSFSLLEPDDPHSVCGSSGTRLEKFEEKKQKKCTEIGINCNFVKKIK